MLKKPKTSFDKGSLTIKANIDRAFRKRNRKILQKLFYNHYYLDGHLGIDDWDFTLFEQCDTLNQLKEKCLTYLIVIRILY